MQILALRYINKTWRVSEYIHCSETLFCSFYHFGQSDIESTQRRAVTVGDRAYDGNRFVQDPHFASCLYDIVVHVFQKFFVCWLFITICPVENDFEEFYIM